MVSGLWRICVAASEIFDVFAESPVDWHTRVSPAFLLLLLFKMPETPSRLWDEMSGDMSLELKPKHPMVRYELRDDTDFKMRK